jgi:hypothetical protein
VPGAPSDPHLANDPGSRAALPGVASLQHLVEGALKALGRVTPPIPKG